MEENPCTGTEKMVSASDVEDRKIQKICRRPGAENRGVFPGNSEKEDRRVKKRAKNAQKAA